MILRNKVQVISMRLILSTRSIRFYFHLIPEAAMATACNKLFAQIQWVKAFQIPSRSIVSKPYDGPKAALFEKQRRFQIDDGVPVHLKGGHTDKLLFTATLVLIAIGIVDGFTTLFKMAMPKKKT